MFTEISWNSYITIVLFILAAYYFIIAVRYYRDDLFQLISGKRSTQVNFTGTGRQSFEKQNLFQPAQSLSDEIQAYLNEAGRNTFNKEDVIQSLRSLLAKYPSIKNSSFQEFIQDLVKTDCENKCSVHLSEEEIIALWV